MEGPVVESGVADEMAEEVRNVFFQPELLKTHCGVHRVVGAPEEAVEGPPGLGMLVAEIEPCDLAGLGVAYEPDCVHAAVTAVLKGMEDLVDAVTILDGGTAADAERDAEVVIGSLGDGGLEKGDAVVVLVEVLVAPDVAGTGGNLEAVSLAGGDVEDDVPAEGGVVVPPPHGAAGDGAVADDDLAVAGGVAGGDEAVAVVGWVLGEEGVEELVVGEGLHFWDDLSELVEEDFEGVEVFGDAFHFGEPFVHLVDTEDVGGGDGAVEDASAVGGCAVCDAVDFVDVFLGPFVPVEFVDLVAGEGPPGIAHFGVAVWGEVLAEALEVGVVVDGVGPALDGVLDFSGEEVAVLVAALVGCAVDLDVDPALGVVAGGALVLFGADGVGREGGGVGLEWAGEAGGEEESGDEERDKEVVSTHGAYIILNII